MSFLFRFGDILLGAQEAVDDSIDKIHRKCTIVVLLLLSIPLFTKQFAGDPIECFTPTYFTDAQSRYVNSYCWTVSTFYVQNEVAENQHMPQTGRGQGADYEEYDAPAIPRRGQQVKVNYYQWAPMILLAKAMTFYMPYVLWKSLAQHRGVSLTQLMKRVSSLSKMNSADGEREALMHEVVEQIQIFIGQLVNEQQVTFHGEWGALTRLTRRCRILITFLFIKTVYLCNTLLQFYLLVSFLGDDYMTHGFNILAHLWAKGEWYVSPRFPLQTLCSIQAAQQGSQRQYQCHCVLPINLFNEKICSIWWFYIFVLLPLTASGIFVWTVRLAPSSRRAFVQHYLWRSGLQGSYHGSQLCADFTIQFLGHDGLFLLRLIEINHGSTIVAQIVAHLYNIFLSSNRISIPPSPSLATGDLHRGLYSSLNPQAPIQVPRSLHPDNEKHTNNQHQYYIIIQTKTLTKNPPVIDSCVQKLLNSRP